MRKVREGQTWNRETQTQQNSSLGQREAKGQVKKKKDFSAGTAGDRTVTKRQEKRRRLLGAVDRWARRKKGEVGKREGIAHLGAGSGVNVSGGQPA